MTSERDFDRLARAWLELGPDEAPERVVAAVLQAAETMPQARRPIRWPLWRSFDMTRLPLVAGLATILVIVIGGGVLLTRGNDPGLGGPVATPSPSPTATAAPSASAAAGAPLPEMLRARWMSGERIVPGIVATAGTSIDLLDLRALAVSPSNDNGARYLISAAFAVGDGQFQLESRTVAGSCSLGDDGLYAWSLSPSGRSLSITGVRDDCSTRLAAVPGTWWKMGCKDPDDNCLGDLDAGTYRTQFVTPRLDPRTNWVPDFGAIAYTVPDGWANRSDWPSQFELTPSSDYALETASGPRDVYHAIEVWAKPAATIQNADCKNEEQTSVERTAAGLVGWVRSQRSLVVSSPTAVTIDGHQGQMVDVRLAPDWTTRCPDVDKPIAVYLTEASGGTDGWSWGIIGAEQQRLIFLDLGDGHVVLIGIDSTYPDRFDELVSQAMPIIGSFRFE